MTLLAGRKTGRPRHTATRCLEKSPLPGRWLDGCLTVVDGAAGQLSSVHGSASVAGGGVTKPAQAFVRRIRRSTGGPGPIGTSRDVLSSALGLRTLAGYSVTRWFCW